AFRIHTTLGPGLLESVYQTVLTYELGRRGLRAVSQQAIPVVYESIRIDTGFRADLVVEDKVIVEIKSVESLATVHKKQLLTYLRLADKRLGLLINFHVPLIKGPVRKLIEQVKLILFYTCGRGEPQGHPAAVPVFVGLPGRTDAPSGGGRRERGHRIRRGLSGSAGDGGIPPGNYRGDERTQTTEAVAPGSIVAIAY